MKDGPNKEINEKQMIVMYHKVLKRGSEYRSLIIKHVN